MSKAKKINGIPAATHKLANALPFNCRAPGEISPWIRSRRANAEVFFIGGQFFGIFIMTWAGFERRAFGNWGLDVRYLGGLANPASPGCQCPDQLGHQRDATPFPWRTTIAQYIVAPIWIAQWLLGPSTGGKPWWRALPGQSKSKKMSGIPAGTHELANALLSNCGAPSEIPPLDQEVALLNHLRSS